eukprot:COSAG02_NODE_145_length_34010_cov_7.359696_2_plen_917_part_00
MSATSLMASWEKRPFTYINNEMLQLILNCICSTSSFNLLLFNLHANQLRIMIPGRCIKNGGIGVQLIDDTENTATLLYPLVDAGSFDTITGVWLHTILAVSSTRLSMFADGNPVQTADYAFPTIAHENLADPDPGSLTQPLSNFSLSDDIYVAAGPAGNGYASNFFAGSLAMLAVDDVEINAHDAACYFRGGEAALSHLALAASHGVSAVISANAQMQYDSDSHNSAFGAAWFVSDHILEAYNGVYSVIGKRDGIPVYQNEAGMYMYGIDTSSVPYGWTVILKTNGDPTFQYSSPLWSDTESVYNPTSEPHRPGNAKYAAYNTQAFDAIKACVGNLQNCLPEHEFAEPLTNAAELFDGRNRREGVRIEDFVNVFGIEDPRAEDECEPQKPGFNSQCNGNNKVRWGYCANVAGEDCQSEDEEDADGVIGFGIQGEDCCSAGAGWTSMFASITSVANAGHEGSNQAWLLVREAGQGAGQSRGISRSIVCEGFTRSNGPTEDWPVSFDALASSGSCQQGQQVNGEAHFDAAEQEGAVLAIELSEAAPPEGIYIMIISSDSTSSGSEWCYGTSIDGLQWGQTCLPGFVETVSVPANARYLFVWNVSPASIRGIRIGRPVQWRFHDERPSGDTVDRLHGGFFEGDLRATASHELRPWCTIRSCPGEATLGTIHVLPATRLELDRDEDSERLAAVLQSNRFAQQVAQSGYSWSQVEHTWIDDSGHEGDNGVFHAVAPGDWTAGSAFQPAVVHLGPTSYRVLDGCAPGLSGPGCSLGYLEEMQPTGGDGGSGHMCPGCTEETAVGWLPPNGLTSPYQPLCTTVARPVRLSTTRAAQYSPNIDRCVLVQAPYGLRVRVAIDSFQTETDYDYLFLYDGRSEAAPLLGDSGNCCPRAGGCASLLYQGECHKSCRRLHHRVRAVSDL